MKIIQYVPLPQDISDFLNRSTNGRTYIYIGVGGVANSFYLRSFKGFTVTRSDTAISAVYGEYLEPTLFTVHYFVEVGSKANAALQEEILKRMAADVIRLAPMSADIDLVSIFSMYNPKDIVYLGQPNRGESFSELFNGGKKFYGFFDDFYTTDRCTGLLLGVNYFAILNHPDNQGIRDYIQNLNKENKVKENSTAEKMAEIANNFMNQKRAEEERTIVADALKIIETAAKNGHKRTELRITPMYTTTETICDILKAKPHGFSADADKEYDFIDVSW